jgi:hypothetical protein
MKSFLIFVCCFFVFNLWSSQPPEDNPDAPLRVDNIWWGVYSSYWSDGLNWSLGHAPHPNENAIIQPGVNHPTIVSDAYCANLLIMSGEMLGISSGNLYVSGNTDVYGWLNYSGAVSIHIGGDLTLYQDSIFLSDQVDSNVFLGGNLTVQDDVILLYSGSFTMTGMNKTITSNLQNHIANFYIANMAIIYASNNGPGFFLDGNLTVLSGGCIYNMHLNPISIVGNLIAWYWDPMTDVAFVGPADSHINLHGSMAHDIIVQKQDTGSYNLIFDDDLTVTGDIIIYMGGVYAGSHTLYLEGSFYDFSPGGYGFSAGTGNVVFNGPGMQGIFATGLFNRIILDKSGTGIDETLRIFSSHVDIASYDWISGSMWVDNSYVNIYDLEDDFLGGSFHASNNGMLHITQDSAGGLDFSGQMIVDSDASIQISGGRSNLVIGAPGSLLIDSGNMSIMQGLEMQGGTTFGNSYGHLLVTGDLMINSSYLSGDYFGEVHLVDNTDTALAISPGILMNPLFVHKDTGILSMTGDVNLGNSMNLGSGNLRTNGFDLSVEGFASVGSENGSQGHLEVNGGTLSIGADGHLLIGNGARLSVLGNATDRAVVTAVNPSLGRYQFIVMDGGTLAADYATFEYMGPEGIRFDSNAAVDPVPGLSNCVFDHVADSGTLLTIDSGQDITVSNAVFPAQSAVGTVYNVAKTVDSGSVSFIGASGAFSGSGYENDPYDRINWQSAVPAVSDLTISRVPGIEPAQLLLSWTYPLQGAVFNIYGSDTPSGQYILEYPSVTGLSQAVAPASARFYYIRAVVSP